MRQTIGAILIAVFLCFCAPSTNAMDLSKHWGFSASGGGIIATNGAFDSQNDLTDILNLGGGFGAEAKYVIIDKVAVGLGVGYDLTQVKEEERTTVHSNANLKPYFTTLQVNLNGTFNFGPLIPDNQNLNPFATAGVGYYSWKFTDDGMGGDPVKLENSEEFKKDSFGFNLGAGLEYFVVENKFSLGGKLNYHYVFAKDEDKFGKDFDNQGFFTFRAGLTYYLPMGE